MAPIYYAATAWTPNDVARRAGYEHEYDYRGPTIGFTPIINGVFLSDTREQIALDANGWPTSMRLADGRVAEAYWSIIGGGRYLEEPGGPVTLPVTANSS